MSAAALLYVHTQLMQTIHVGSHGCCRSSVPAVPHLIHPVESDHHVVPRWVVASGLLCHARPHQMIVGVLAMDKEGLLHHLQW